MTAVSPIKAHQQTTVPLLRRPRPPKQRQTSSKDANKKTPRAQSKAPITNSNATPAFPLHTISRQTNDSLYTDTYEDDDTGQFEIHSLYPTGPECFPPGKTMRAARASYPVPQLAVGERDGELIEPDDDDAIAFTLNDFRISTKVVHPLPIKTAPEVVISRQNYLKLTSWFAANVPTQDSLNTLEIQVDTTAPANRKPRHQALLGESRKKKKQKQSSIDCFYFFILFQNLVLWWRMHCRAVVPVLQTHWTLEPHR